MSVVRKYAKGGSPQIENYNDLENFLMEEAKNNSLTSKGESNLMKQIPLWVAAANKGLFNKDEKGEYINYSQNPDETYSIKPLEGFDTTSLSGNIKAIKPNFFGQLNLKNQAEANTWIANAVNKYLTSKVAPIVENKEYNIQNINDYIKEKYFNNNENFENSWEDYKKTNLGNDESKIQNYLMEKAAEHLRAYNSKIPAAGETFNKVQNYNKLLESINNNNWLNFKTEANKLGWDFTDIGNVVPVEEQVNQNTEQKPQEAATQPEITNKINPLIHDTSGVKLEVIPAINDDLELSVSQMLSGIQEQPGDARDINNEVLNIYNDIKNGYDIDSSILQKIKWIWNNKNLLSPVENQYMLEIVNSLKNKYNGTPIKFESGGKTHSNDRLDVKIASGTTLHNLFKTPFTKEKAFDVASVAGDVVSFIPGLGVAGGLTTTASDIAKDIAKDGFQWSDVLNMNTAANLGFTVLAGIGMGGLKNFVKLAKTANVADKTIDVAKTIEKLGVVGKDLNAAEDLTKIASKVKTPTIERLSTVLDKLDAKKAETLLGRKITEQEFPTLKNALATDLKNVIIQENKLEGVQKVANYIGKGLTSGTAKTIAIGTMLAGAYPTVKRIGESILPGGRLGNIEVEDIGKAAQFGLIGKSFIKNKGITKALEKQTTKVIEPEKHAFTALDSEGKGILDGKLVGKLPEKEKVSMFKWVGRSAKREELNKEYNKKLVDMFNKVSTTKLPEGAIIDKIEKTSPEYIKKLYLKNKPSTEAGQSLESARKEYDKAKNIFDKYNLGTVEPVKPINTVKKLSDTETKNVEDLTNSLKKSVEEVRSIKKIWDKKPKKFTGYNTRIKKLEAGKEDLKSKIRTIKHKNGGVLKAQWGAVLQKDIGEINGVAKNLLNTNRPETKLYDTKKLMPMNTPKKEVIGSDVKKDRFINLGFVKDIDLKNKDLLNSIGFVNTLTSNSKIAKLQKQAALAGLVNLEGPEKQYIRTPELVSPIYEGQANKVLSSANRLNSSISDFDKRANVMLAANKQANELREKGAQTDLQSLQQARAMQQQANAQWGAATADITNKNKLATADVLSKVNLIDANKVLANNTAIQNMLRTFSQNQDVQEKKKMYKNYFDLISGPESKNLTNQWNALIKQEELAKQNWGKNKSENATLKTTWEESNLAKEIAAKKKQINSDMENYKNKVTYAGIALQNPYLSKGGTLADKKELIRYKAQISKDQKEEDELYKAILKNNELLLKSLIKVFK